LRSLRNLSRNRRECGSKEKDFSLAVEMTEGGPFISLSAVDLTRFFASFRADALLFASSA
jgi:hypothetical protein